MKLVFYGDPKTKKNHSSMITLPNGTKKLIPSKYYSKYERDCLKQIVGSQKVKISYPVNVKCIFYKERKIKVDLTNLLEAIDDILVKGEVVADDNRDIIASHDGSIVLHDKDNPRCEIEIDEREGYKQWKK